MTSRKKPGVAFWATVVVVVALLYPISFGPACWLADWLDWDGESEYWIAIAYRPFLVLTCKGPGWVQESVEWYGDPQGNLGAGWYAINLTRAHEP